MDERRREQERAAALGDPEARAEAIREELRSGRRRLAEAELRAHMGEPAFMAATGLPAGPRDLPGWLTALGERRSELAWRAWIGLVELVLSYHLCFRNPPSVRDILRLRRLVELLEARAHPDGPALCAADVLPVHPDDEPSRALFGEVPSLHLSPVLPLFVLERVFDGGPPPKADPILLSELDDAGVDLPALEAHLRAAARRLPRAPWIRVAVLGVSGALAEDALAALGLREDELGAVGSAPRWGGDARFLPLQAGGRRALLMFSHWRSERIAWRVGGARLLALRFRTRDPAVEAEWRPWQQALGPSRAITLHPGTGLAELRGHIEAHIGGWLGVDDPLGARLREDPGDCPLADEVPRSGSRVTWRWPGSAG